MEDIHAVYSPNDPPLPQLERVRDKCDEVLRKAFAPVVGWRLRAYCEGQRVAFLDVLTRAFTACGPEDIGTGARFSLRMVN